MKNALYFEPWLDARYAEDFALSEGEVERGQQSLAVALSAPSREVTVRDLNGKEIRTEVIYGAYATVDSVWVEATLDQAKDLAEWKQVLGSALKQIRTWLNRDWRLSPVNAGKHKLVTESGDTKARVTFVFTRGLFDPAREDAMAGRYGSLLGKLTVDSREIGSGSLVAGVDDDTNVYRAWDSFYFIRRSAHCPVDDPIIPLYGVKDIHTLASKMGTGNPQPVVWGVALSIPDEYWHRVIEGAGLGPESEDAAVVACNRKHVKFMSGERQDGLTFWRVRPTLQGKRARVTSEERQFDALTPEGIKWLADRRRKNAETIGAAFTAAADGNRQPLVDLVASVLEEATSLDPDEITDEEREELDVLFASTSRARIAIWAGLPLPGTEVVELLKPLVTRRIKGIGTDGITQFSAPSNVVGEWGTGLNKAEMTRLNLQIGDHVTDIRYPNTGTGMLNLQVRKTHHLNAVFAHPVTGATYQAEDYDTDVSVVVASPVRLVDNDKLVAPVAKNTDTGVVTLASVFQTASFGKLNIGLTDHYLSRVIGTGRTEFRSMVGNRLQALIDMAKKNVDPGQDIGEVLKREQVPAEPRSLRLQKGRLADPVSLSYLPLLLESWKEETPVSSLYRDALSVLPAVVSGRNSTYVNRCKAAYQATQEDEVLEKYEAALRVMGMPVYSHQTQRSFYEYRHFDEEWSRSIDAQAAGTLAKSTKDTCIRAFWIVGQYNRYLDLLKERNTDLAYEVLGDLRARLMEHPVQAGRAMTYLFWMLAGRHGSKTQAVVERQRQAIGGSTRVTRLKSAGILATLPPVLDQYNVKSLVERAGYQHDYSIIVRRKRQS